MHFSKNMVNSVCTGNSGLQGTPWISSILARNSISLKNQKIPGFTCLICKLHETLVFGLDIAAISMLTIQVFQKYLLYVFRNVPSILLKLRIYLQIIFAAFFWYEQGIKRKSQASMLERENQDTWTLSPLVMIFHHCTATSVISGGFESSRGYSWITVLCSTTQYFANHISALITGQRPLVHHFCSQCSIYGKAKSRMEQAHIVPTVIMLSRCALQ